MKLVQIVFLLALSCTGLAQKQDEVGFTARDPKCHKHERVDISFVSDDGVILYICGQKVRQSSHFDERQTFTHENVCDDFMIELNNNELSSGVALLATYNGQKYGTTSFDPNYRVPGTIPIFADAIYRPQGNWRDNPSNYNFSSWTPAVVVSTILGHGQEFDRLASMGAYPINVRNGNVPAGTYGLRLRIRFPFCV